MRKILSILFAISILMASMVPVAAAETEEPVNRNVEEAVELLGTLGVLKDADMTTFASEKVLTRGEFARYAAGLVRAPETGGNTYFYDVPENHYAYTAVSELVERKIINGDGGKRFNPDEPISFQDACTMLVKLLFYERYAEANGGYPGGYLTAARRLEILNNTPGQGDVTLGAAAILLRNTLLTQIMDIDSIDADGAVTYRQSGMMLLTQYYDAYYNTGLFTAVWNMGVFGGKELEQGKIEIDNLVYHTAGKSYEKFFGREIAYIYSENKVQERTLLWMRDMGTTRAMSISAEEQSCVFEEADMRFRYYPEEGSRALTAAVSQGASIIYNGENYNGSLKELTEGGRYEMSLLATEGTSLYDVVMITVYDIFQIEAIDTSRSILYGDNQQAYALDAAAVPYLSIQNQDMEAIGLADIREKSVAAAAQSISGRTLSILVSSETVSGTISSVFDRGGCLEVTVNEKAYRCPKGMDGIEAGNTAVLYLDPFLRIYKAKRQSGSEFLAFPIALAEGTGVFSRGVRLKLLAENGSVSEFETDARLKVDGAACGSSEEIVKRLCVNGQPKRQLLACRVNDDGAVTVINTPGGGEGLTLEKARETALYKNNSAKLGTMIAVNTDTKIFCVPQENEISTARDEEFAVRAKGDLINDTNYIAESYSLAGETGDYADAVVIYGTAWGAASYSTAAIVIDSIYSSVNAEGEIAEAFSGYQGTAKVELICDSGFSLAQFRPGDVVKVTKNSKGDVTEVMPLYQYGQAVDGSGYKNTFNSAARYMLVRVNDRIGPLVKVGYNTGADFDEVFNLESAPVVVYDASVKGDKVRKGTYGDILTYSSTGNPEHRMFIQSSYESLKMVVIYLE